ncbi:IclR family transcriptional regulator [Actinacidiphila sp. ITFR-21]|uniref:IclR family transcriptional regulator n=1 Tax=Actinacidiphila sp. ITFR-21 TaxID=3075199 RepID=UPI002889AEE5|nr:IclR family transcriptional regulator [Streptomyces sp. ITFR-21]WNI18740.1 IclR family transcriptional regulator [Streptomyces sp. ITFR-21]
MTVNETAAEDTASDRDQRKRRAGSGVQSLHRATSILDAVGRSPQGMGLADLCQVIGLPSSTIFHLAKTMVELGLLRQEEETKRYRIGHRLFSLAAGALDEQELLAVATPVLANLSQQVGETSHIGVRTGNTAVIIGRCEGPGAIRVAERIGAPRPLHATSVGKVLLASLPDEELNEYLRSGPLTRVTPRTTTDPETLLAMIREVRSSGVAFDDGEYIPDGRCVAAPLRDFRHRVVGAIGISAPVWRLGIERVAAVQQAVKTSAAELSQALGHSPADDAEETPQPADGAS